MRIQEMRSGFSHLKKKVEAAGPTNIFEIRSRLEPASMPKRIERVTFSELDEQRWSVVSFERAEVSYLTYSQAVTAMAKLETRRVSGLCIVTDDAASRIKA